MKRQSKTQIAEWMGYEQDIDAMDGIHDRLHHALCSWLGIESLSLRIANGESFPVGSDEWHLANYEEDAVLNVQRFIQQLKIRGIECPNVFNTDREALGT